MRIYISLAVCLLGLVMFLVVNPPTPENRWHKIGFAMFCAGLLAFLLTVPLKAVGFLQ